MNLRHERNQPQGGLVEDRLPRRYLDPWKKRVVALALDGAKPEQVMLEIGGSDRPTIAPSQRPLDVTYVGLDVDAQGLSDGAYDERIVGNIEQADETLVERFDLILSLNTFEHVADLRSAFRNMRSYLKPEGRIVLLFSGRWAAFSMAARLMPHSLRMQLMRHVLGGQPENHFPIRYDRCSYRHLARILEDWSEPVVVPLYQAATYFKFARRAQEAYLAYEHWAIGHPNLATHYLVTAKRPPVVPLEAR